MQFTQFTNTIHELWELQGREVNKMLMREQNCTQASAFATSLQPWQFSVIRACSGVRELPVVDGVDELQDHLKVVGEEQRLLVAVLHDDVQDPEGVEAVLVLVDVGTLLNEDVLDVLDVQEQVAALGEGECDLGGHHVHVTNDGGLLNPHVGVHSLPLLYLGWMWNVPGEQ